MFQPAADVVEGLDCELAAAIWAPIRADIANIPAVSISFSFVVLPLPWLLLPACLPLLFSPLPLNSAKALNCPFPDPLFPWEALKAIIASRGFDVVVVIGLPSDIYIDYIMKIVLNEINFPRDWTWRRYLYLLLFPLPDLVSHGVMKNVNSILAASVVLYI